MAMASIGGIIGLICFLFFLLVPIGLLVAVQVWLCRKNVKLGLILPAISLVLSLLLALSLAACSSGGSNETQSPESEAPGTTQPAGDSTDAPTGDPEDPATDAPAGDPVTITVGATPVPHVEILEKVKDRFEFPVYWGCDLQTEHERYLTEEVYQKPVFVTDYPKEIKAFYMRMNEDNKTVAAVDLLVPGVGEIIGGSQREERTDKLLERIRELGLREEDYWWYLDLRRFGGTRHAGYGLGFERLIMYMTGIGNIRDVLPFPRTTGSAEF